MEPPLLVWSSTTTKKRKKPPSQKNKPPQRGLGVAQLERLRMQEQQHFSNVFGTGESSTTVLSSLVGIPLPLPTLGFHELSSSQSFVGHCDLCAREKQQQLMFRFDLDGGECWKRWKAAEAREVKEYELFPCNVGGGTESTTRGCDKQGWMMDSIDLTLKL